MSDFPLNPEQLEAVKSREGYYIVMSGPGSGKTRTIVERVHSLLDEGYPPETILALTFTREAALEMGKRAALSEDQKIFRTFHSFCLEVVHQEASKLPFTLLHAPPEAGQQRKLLGTLCRSNRLDFKKLTSYISNMKRNGVETDKAMEKARGAEEMRLALAYRQYEQKCREEGWLDFDSMIVESVRLLEANEEVRARWQFKFVLVDEAQDTDDIQWRLVTLISEKSKSVFAVGDEEQLIYEWRGAEANGLSRFEQRFHGAKTIYLFRNYRSTPEIVKFCKQFAPKESKLIDLMVSERNSGPVPRVLKFGSDSDESSKILGSITDPEHTAVLARTNRQLARFENACIDRGIKYNLLGKSGFWTQPEVRYLLAYVQSSDFPSDAAVKTIIQSPFRYTKYLKKRDLVSALERASKADKEATGKTTPFITMMASPEILGQFETNQQENIRAATHFIKTMRHGPTANPAMVLQDILARADIRTYYETEEEGDEDNDALENINELYKVSTKFGTVHEFIAHARKAIAASRKSKQPRLTLSTIHQAKGKEYLTVYVAGVTQDILPHKRGVLSEEKRIMYVALTRAADNLTVTFFGSMSPFLQGHWDPKKQEEFEKQPLPGFQGQQALFEGATDGISIR